MAKLKPYNDVFYLWDYVPSLGAAIALAVVFTILTATHLWRMVRSKLWSCVPFVVGGTLMIGGFIVRAIAVDRTDNLGLFVMQAVLLVLPPAFFAATLYMSYTRIVRSVDHEDLSLISTRWSTRVFLLADITCITVQAGGAGLLANQKPSAAKAGQYILVGGLVLHIVVFVCFLLLCGTFHHRYRAWLTVSGHATDVPWKVTLVMLYVCSVVIMARNVFRTAEYVMGREGYLMLNEWPIYVLDFGPMVAVMVAFYIWYPGRLAATEAELLELNSRDGSASEPNLRSKSPTRTGD